MGYETIHAKYSSSLQLGELNESDLQAAGDFLEATSFQEMTDWTSRRTKEYTLKNGQTFRMVVDRPIDGDEGKLVVVGGEYGSGITPGALARARIVRDMVVPEATLVYQPNMTYKQADNTNLSPDERNQLHNGEIAPMLSRYARVIEDDLGSPEDVTFYGPSQGGVTALGYAALGYAANPNTPPSAVATVDSPNFHRSHAGLIKDFFLSAGQLKSTLRENFGDPEEQFAKDTMDACSTVNLGRRVIDFFQRDNLAMLGILRRGSSEDQIAAVLKKGGSVVQAYATASRVSSIETHLQLATLFEDNPRYRSVRLEGSDHTVTQQYALGAALARTARKLNK